MPTMQRLADNGLTNATMATVLRDAGWSTFWVGKNHNVPVDEWTSGPWGLQEELATGPGL
jgi:arylsulfatase